MQACACGCSTTCPMRARTSAVPRSAAWKRWQTRSSAGDADASDRTIERMILANAAIVARSLEPQFGAEMRLQRFGDGLRAL